MKNIKDMTVVIEDVIGCPGHCAGCILSDEQRVDKEPKFTMSLLDQSLKKIEEHLYNLDELERFQLVFGIADHFVLPLDYLKEIVLKSAKLINKLNFDKESGIFITTSMIGNPNVILEKVKFLQNLSEENNVRLYFNVVLDPKTFHIPKLLESFSKNVKESFKISKSLDLTINLSYETLKYVTPEKLINYCIDFNFNHLIINWLPIKNNIKNVYKNTTEINEWLINLINYSKEKDFYITFQKTVEDILKFSKDYENESLIYSIDTHFINNSINNLIIDSTGKIFINYEAIGDIPHGENLGIKPLGTVYDKESIVEMIHKNSKYYTMLAVKNLMNSHCLDCNFIKECGISGFHYYNKILFDNYEQTKDEMEKCVNNLDCYHLGKSFFNLLKK